MNASQRMTEIMHFAWRACTLPGWLLREIAPFCHSFVSRNITR